ncbi:TetR/AcrR family transcriptional regulator [Citrobacter sp. BNK-42]|uniref:TetR/AcrR family transcriptional regulator n=1 Tax=Citrobacter sp. BNK-42 TaxID=3376175 RepID=UPI003B511A70
MAKPGRPKSFDRTEALTKAMEVFWKYGYEPASLSSLRQAMGISSASLYNIWSSKEELFKDALNLYIEKCGNQFLFEKDDNCSALDSLKSSLIHTAKIQTNPSHPLGCMVFLAAINCGPESQHICKMLTSLKEQRRKNIEELILTAQQEGSLTLIAGPKELSQIIDLLLRGMALQAQDGVKEDSILHSIDLILNLFSSKS